MKALKIACILCCILNCTICSLSIYSQEVKFSTAGFHNLKEPVRKVYNFNHSWRYFQGDAPQAFKSKFDDTNWQEITAPHASSNSKLKPYQGTSWYRKKFQLPNTASKRRWVLHFEGLMGKVQAWVNGKEISIFSTGFLPFEIELDSLLLPGENCVALKADNRTVLPSQAFYLAGLYRDVWLYSTANSYITSAVTNSPRGGGVQVQVKHVDGYDEVLMQVTTHLYAKEKRRLEYVLIDPLGEEVYRNKTYGLKGLTYFEREIEVPNPILWSPEAPMLYRLELRLWAGDKVVDGLALLVGMKQLEFQGREGLYLNELEFEDKLIGTNHFQTYPLVGHALPNSAHLRDVQFLKSTGCNIVRVADFAADPAFLDACDQLGMFVIQGLPSNPFTPSTTQYFKKDYEDFRELVRRDRNHASLFLWEPILRSDKLPKDYVTQVSNVLFQEFSYAGGFSVTDADLDGTEAYKVLFTPLPDTLKSLSPEEASDAYQEIYESTNKSYITKSFGSPLNNTNANSETNQLAQIQDYFFSSKASTSLETLARTPSQHMGALIHRAFDDGYSSNSGALADAYREPKYGSTLFKAHKLTEALRPVLKVVHHLQPNSSSDMTVITNCDEVRLIRFGSDTIVRSVSQDEFASKYPLLAFKNVFNSQELNAKPSAQRSFMFQGLVDQKVMVEEVLKPQEKPSTLQLAVDNKLTPLVADGADFIKVVVTLLDKNNFPVTQGEYQVKCTLSGAGLFLSSQNQDAQTLTFSNGKAVVLIKSESKPGAIRLKVSLAEAPSVSNQVSFKSVKPTQLKLIGE